MNIIKKLKRLKQFEKSLRLSNEMLELQGSNGNYNVDTYMTGLYNRYESPYCEVCGHCGEIGCCGIKRFIEEHINGKTNCKNEDKIVQDLISICEYETEVFKKNDTLNKCIDELLKKYQNYVDNIYSNMSQTNTMVGEYIEIYDKEISKVWQKHECYKQIIKDLKSLKGE